MALLPARRGGTIARPGSQAADRWDPFGELEDLYEPMGQLMDRAFDGLWQQWLEFEANVMKELTVRGDRIH